jgi:hypothetical protein
VAVSSAERQAVRSVPRAEIATCKDFFNCMKEAIIPGGATLWARQTIESEIFCEKPAIWFKIWFYLVNRVSHENTKKYSRGETFLQTEWIADKTKATPDQIKKALVYFRRSSMISTRRSTRGIWLKVLKYEHFQTLDNYYYNVKAPDKALEKHQRSTREAPRYNNNVKNDKNDNNIILHSEETSQGKEINEIIYLFEPINPSYKRLFANKTQRGATERLLKQYGREKLEAGIKMLPDIICRKYAPRITTPVQLEEKMADLKIYIQQEQDKKLKITKL